MSETYVHLQVGQEFYAGGVVVDNDETIKTRLAYGAWFKGIDIDELWMRFQNFGNPRSVQLLPTDS